MSDAQAAALAYALAMTLMIGYAVMTALSLRRARLRVRPPATEDRDPPHRPSSTSEIKPQPAVKTS